jgi:histidinol dehydrogenase
MAKVNLSVKDELEIKNKSSTSRGVVWNPWKQILFKDCRIIIPSECLIIAHETARADYTAEVYVGKIAGSNHILPTGAAAHCTGGLWVGKVF